MSSPVPLFTLHWYSDDPAAESFRDSDNDEKRSPQQVDAAECTTLLSSSDDPNLTSLSEEESPTEQPSHHSGESIDLVPRGYQLELFHRAYQENIIAFLETGSGKTLVAALLIKKTLDDLEACADEQSTTVASERSDLQLSPQKENTHVGENSIHPTPSLENSVLHFSKTAPIAPATEKIAVFLVHRVPLVPQQAEVIRKVLKNRNIVGAYYGERGVDDWSSSKWAQSLRTHKVLVMTAQIFLNLLRHGLLDIRNIALLVLDEVHHATKNHPYRRLFVEFYHTLNQNEPRPRVFGMTATPVKAKAASQNEGMCLNAMLALEATLDATLVTVSGTSLEEVEEVVPKPEEFIITYARSDPTIQLNGVDLKELETPAVAALMEIATGGEVSATASEYKKDDSESSELEPHECRLLLFLSMELGLRAACHFANELCSLKDLSPDAIISQLLLEASPKQIENGGIQEKVCTLLDILLYEHRRCKVPSVGTELEGSASDQFRCIIFVHERITAVALMWLIEEMFKNLECSELSARMAVGVQNTDAHIRMTQSKLLQTLEDFRTGKFGILVATNVVEEGLDVAACRLVIAFDVVSSPATYVQGRGRARKRGARYIAFLEKGSIVDYNSMLRAREGARLMVNVASAGQSTEAERREHREKIAKESRSLEKRLFSRTTRARVSGIEALNLLHRYNFMKASTFKEEENLQPVYTTVMLGNGTYTAKVELHPKVSIDGGSCIVPQAHEITAKRLAALDAYTKLYEIGEVDEFLLPKRPLRPKRVMRIIHEQNELSPLPQNRRKRRRQKEVQSRASKKDKRLRECHILHPESVQYRSEMKSTSQVIQDTEAAKQNLTESISSHGGDITMDFSTIEDEDKGTMLMYSLQLDHDIEHLGLNSAASDQIFGILLKNDIPAEDLTAIRCPSGDALLTLTFEKSIAWSEEFQARAYKYVRSVQLCLRGKSPGSDLAMEIEKRDYGTSTATGFLMVPLKKNMETNDLQIDWDNIDCLLTYGWRYGPLKQDDATNKHILEHALVSSYHENLSRVYFSGKIHGELRASSNPAGFLNAVYKSFGDYFRQKHDTPLADPDQAMLEGCSVLDKMSSLSTSTFMLPPETCRVIPISPMACYVASQLPRWQTFLALRSCWRRNRITYKASAFLSFARALQPNVNNVSRDGADLSYERLEFLGDAVLKVIFSMAAFVMRPDANEGGLSDERDIEVSNQRLADRALEMKINDCVAFSGVSQKAKAWPWFWATHQNKCIQISEKVLADCVEALIGVQFLEGGIEQAAVFMDKHKLLPGACKVLGIDLNEGGVQPWGVSVNVPKTSDGDNRTNSSIIHEVEEIIGYTFKNKQHLVIALTHGSYMNGSFASYQRYEYLGDAIIGFLLLSHFFEKYPGLSPGELTRLRGPALSNDLFARVIVSLKLHEKFWYECLPVKSEISKFAQLIANEEEDDDDVCKTMTVPKVLADLLESIIGAIVVDQRMRLDGVKDLVLRLMHAELERFANPERFKHNPVSELVHLVQKMFCVLPEYKYLEQDDDKEKICSIIVEDRVISTARGPTRRVAKHKAATQGLVVLKEEQKTIEEYKSMEEQKSLEEQTSVEEGKNKLDEQQEQEKNRLDRQQEQAEDDAEVEVTDFMEID